MGKLTEGAAEIELRIESINTQIGHVGDALGILANKAVGMESEFLDLTGRVDEAHGALETVGLICTNFEARLATIEAALHAAPVPTPAPAPNPPPTTPPVTPPVPIPDPQTTAGHSYPIPAATGAPEWHGRNQGWSGSWDLYIPPGGAVRALLFWSTNAFSYSGDEYFADSALNAWAKRNRVAIMGMVNYPEGHETQALIDSVLKDLAAASSHPELTTVPWLARGFSAAGYRAWHIIKNCQDRGLAFSWFSGSPLPVGTEPSPHPVGVDPAWAEDIFTLDANDAELFGLFCAGALDSPRRKHTLAYVEGQNGTHDAQWDYAELPGAAHDSDVIAGPSAQLDRIFFEEVLNHGKDPWPTARYVHALNQFKRNEFPLEADAPAPTPVPTTPPTTLPPLPATTAGLVVSGNKLLSEDGAVWLGRGVNMHDCRSCDACEGLTPDAMLPELKRRVDEVVDVWHANFLRLCLEDDGRHIAYEADDPYRRNIRDLVQYIGTKPGVRVLVSLWDWPGLLAGDGVPTDAAVASWSAIASDLANQGHVLFGLCNEPENNYGGADDDRRIGQFRKCLAAIRTAEAAARVPAHVVLLQGLGGWSSVWGKLLRTDFGDDQVAYECHEYSHRDAWQSEVWTPAVTKPIVVGEFGAAPGNYMTIAETADFMASAKGQGVHHLAWTFHMRCPPNLLADNSHGGCGVGMALVPSAYGQVVKDGLQA